MTSQRLDKEQSSSIVNESVKNSNKRSLWLDYFNSASSLLAASLFSLPMYVVALPSSTLVNSDLFPVVKAFLNYFP